MIELELGAWAKDQAMGRAAEMEHTELPALSDALPFVRCDLAARHFRHADREEAHQSDFRVVCVDEDDRACRDLRNVSLRVVGPGRIEAVSESFGKVGAVLDVSPD